jgi:hypothetical protein
MPVISQLFKSTDFLFLRDDNSTGGLRFVYDANCRFQCTFSDFFFCTDDTDDENERWFPLPLLALIYPPTTPHLFRCVRFLAFTWVRLGGVVQTVSF